MGHSSLVGTDKAPQRPKGTDEESLGPSDITDSGSDTIGADAVPEADPFEPVDVTLGRDRTIAPIEGTSETSDETEATDIGTDRIIEPVEDDLPEDMNLDDGDEDVLPKAARGGKTANPS